MNRSLPTFFVIGAQKAGTTTLHHWLSRQSDLCLPKGKETHFFDREDRYLLGIDWYLSRFAPVYGHAVAGEVCPDYLYFEKTPERIHQHIQAPRFILVFRHPVDRAYSHYLMSVRRGHEALPFGEALLAEPARLNRGDDFHKRHFSYLSRGLYTDQVMRYLKIFPESDFLFLKFDDVFSHEKTLSAFKKICDFIGSSGSLSTEEAMEKRHAASKSRMPFLTRWLIREYRWKKVFYVFPEEQRRKLRRAVIGRNTTDIENRADREEICAQISREAVVAIEKDIPVLENLTGLDLKDWLASIPSTPAK